MLTFPQRSLASTRRKRGVALVVVLGAMALIAFLVLTILTLNHAEQRAATNSAELTDVRTLADLPAQVVISQIRRATQNLGVFYNWTSQPGLIRVFSLEAATDPSAPPKLLQYRYPLYSTQALYAEGALDLAAEASELAQWATSKALFVDLNEPIEVRQDLRTGAPIGANVEGALVYPILDPAAFERVGNDGESRIQGLTLTGAAPTTSTRHRMPMPVRWLYVLSNGKILSPLPSSSPTDARFDMAEFQPASGEPAPRIIGRIAFWTDDESCKVNLNTASEPAPWHPPMTVSERDRAAADSQPVRGEYHRLSGHPAYTALSPVFRSFGIGNPAPQMQPQPQPPGINAAGTTAFTDYLGAVHSLLRHTPQRDTGSNHGTQIVEDNTAPPAARSTAAISNVDDLLFDSGTPNGSAATRMRNGYQSVGGYALDEADIRRARFCLTTHSSAPETNPFNQPKVSLWPIQKDPALRTRTDQLMALAATLGGTATTRAYYGLLRDSAWTSPTSPGSSQSTNADLAAGTRNFDLFNWLKTQTTYTFPTYSGSFESKYGALNRDHLLLSMFDLMRWSANPGNAWPDAGPAYDYLAPSTEGAVPHPGAGMTTPLIADTGAGQTLRSPGRIPTITEAAIVFIATNAKKTGGAIDVETEPPFEGFAKQTTEVRAFIVLEPFITSPGLPAINPSVKYVLKGLNGPSPDSPETAPAGFQFNMTEHRLNDRLLVFGASTKPYELINQVTFSPSQPSIQAAGGVVRRFGGDATSFTGLTALFVQQNGQPRNALAIDDPIQQFPWFSNRIEINASDPPPFIPYSGGDVVLEIRHAVTDALLQEIALPFGQLNGDLPIPRLHPDDFNRVTNASSDDFILNRFTLTADPAQPDAPPYLPLIKKGDVVRSISLNPNAPHRGDVRVVASRYQVPKEWFAANPVPPPHPEVYQSHGLRETAFDLVGQIGPSLDPVSNDRREPATTTGALLPSETGLPSLPLPAIPQGFPAALARSDFANENATDFRFGDWETGTSNLPDGPFFSRQDLLNAASQSDARRGAHNAVGAAYTNGGQLSLDDTGLNHTPQRQISSAIQFGALNPYVFGIPGAPSNASYGPPDPEPWRSLLFCPNPASRTTAANGPYSVLDHPGFGSPADHLWLDFFWTPAVEPSFLSPAFSTQGKINLNFQMIPFTWIERSTALHAAFKGVRIPALPHNAASLYKTAVDLNSSASPTTPEFLYEVDMNQTLSAFRERFTRGDVFIQPSEICNFYLMPKRIPEYETEYDRNLTPAPADPATLKLSDLNLWWNGDPTDPRKPDAFELTGDNLRESPYAQVYPRLCTRSNVYKVHYRVQLISKSRATPANQWNIETEKITAEQRGAAVIERFLDPNDPNIPDMVGSNLALDEFYRYRIVSTEPFTP